MVQTRYALLVPLLLAGHAFDPNAQMLVFSGRIQIDLAKKKGKPIAKITIQDILNVNAYKGLDLNRYLENPQKNT